MPKSTSTEKSNIVIDALNRGMSRGDISSACGISKRAITRISTNLKKHGTANAPPTGAKLGRPVKLTEEQAGAMVVWMTREDHIFYVKDLVAYLRDRYGYRGCEGTVRRCLAGAGYRRKLPWHKSQKTVWIPPDREPDFTTSSTRDDKTASCASLPPDHISEPISPAEDEDTAAPSAELSDKHQLYRLDAVSDEGARVLDQHWFTAPDQSATSHSQNKTLHERQQQQQQRRGPVIHGMFPYNTTQDEQWPPDYQEQPTPRYTHSGWIREHGASQPMSYTSDASCRRKQQSIEQQLAEKDAIIAHLQRQLDAQNGRVPESSDHARTLAYGHSISAQSPPTRSYTYQPP